MDRVILQGIYQVLKDMVEKQQENQEALLESLNEVKTAVANIKISADSINLNTDTLEAKLDAINSSINSLKTNIDAVKTSVNTVNTSIGTNTSEITDDLMLLNRYLDSMQPRYGQPLAEDATFIVPTIFYNNTATANTYTVQPWRSGSEQAKFQITVAPYTWCPISIKSIEGVTEDTKVIVYGGIGD